MSFFVFDILKSCYTLYDAFVLLWYLRLPTMVCASWHNSGVATWYLFTILFLNMMPGNGIAFKFTPLLQEAVHSELAFTAHKMLSRRMPLCRQEFKLAICAWWGILLESGQAGMVAWLCNREYDGAPSGWIKASPIELVTDQCKKKDVSRSRQILKCELFFFYWSGTISTNV